MATQPSYPNLRYHIPSYCLIYHYDVDLFFSVVLKVPLFSAGSPEKKEYSPSANSASEAGGEKHPLTYSQSNAGTIPCCGKSKGII